MKIKCRGPPGKMIANYRRSALVLQASRSIVSAASSLPGPAN